MKRIEYSVAGGPGGLFVECRSAPKAVPVWYVRMKNTKGTNVYKRLGTVAELTLTAAKREAASAKAEQSILVKQEPEQKPAIGEMSLDTFWTDHYLGHAKLHKRSWKRDEQLYRIRIKPKFGEKKLSAIARYEVERFQQELLQDGLSHSSASHHAKLMKHLLNLAVQWEMLEKNVLNGIPLVLALVDNTVENYLNEDQLKILVEVLRDDKCRTSAMILLFLISTGARLNEAFTATWNNVDLEAGVWKVDAIRAKGKRARSIPLNDSAKWVLEQLESKGKSAYLFPSPAKAAEGEDAAYTTVTRMWYRIRKLAGISDKVRIHDLRHSYLSLLARKGASLSMIQMIAGHADARTTTRYIHMSSSTLGEIANLASVIVPRAQPATTPPMEAAPSQPEVGAVTEQEVQSAQILVFSKAA
jgi:integrase